MAHVLDREARVRVREGTPVIQEKTSHAGTSRAGQPNSDNWPAPAEVDVATRVELSRVGSDDRSLISGREGVTCTGR
jgi:hypothetical protein